jgi:hypothetical protein
MRIPDADPGDQNYADSCGCGSATLTFSDKLSTLKSLNPTVVTQITIPTLGTFSRYKFAYYTYMYTAILFLQASSQFDRRKFQVRDLPRSSREGLHLCGMQPPFLSDVSENVFPVSFFVKYERLP